MKNKNKRLKIWDNYSYSITNQTVLTKTVIDEAISKFWGEILPNVDNDQHIIALFRVKTIDNLIQTLGHLKRLNKGDKDYYAQYIRDVISIKADDYKTQIINEIIISYGIKEGVASLDKSCLGQEIEATSEIKHLFYKHYKLPITFDPTKYGKIIHYDKSTNSYIVQISDITVAKISQIDKDKETAKNLVEIYTKGNLVLKYEDQYISKHRFSRKIGLRKYQYTHTGDIELFTVSKPTRFIKPKKSSRIFNEKIITLDIETKLVGASLEHKPYLIAYFDGQKSYSFFLSEYKSSEDMIKTCILSLCRAKYHRHKIYIHNLANFDGVFLLKHLAKLGEIKPLINNGKLNSIEFRYTPDNSNYTIVLEFRDSYQILLSSLKKLGKSFDVDTQKSIFPYRFVNFHSLNYVGFVPPIRYFDNISLEEYNNYAKRFNDIK